MGKEEKERGKLFKDLDEIITIILIALYIISTVVLVLVKPNITDFITKVDVENSTDIAKTVIYIILFLIGKSIVWVIHSLIVGALILSQLIMLVIGVILNSKQKFKYFLKLFILNSVVLIIALLSFGSNLIALVKVL